MRVFKEFFDVPAEELAVKLLGCKLIHTINGQATAGIIVETEAYHQSDEASHSFRGMTPRTEMMFGEAGHAYVYLSYGLHWCFNVVADRKGVGAAVLIRALQPTEGIEHMQKRRNNSELLALCSGPAKLTQAMNINKLQNGADLIKSELYIVQENELPDFEVSIGPRIGISKAIETPLRFWIKDNKFVSRLK